jgi:diacylglycerol O-acyltransferase / wax synthase
VKETPHMSENGQVRSERLSGADAAFLYLERKEIPLHIACVSVFEGAIPFDKFVANIDSKLHLIPRYRQIAVAPPFNIGYPTWEWDPDFDIHRHIFHVRLEPPGGDAELEALAGRILSPLMDRSKPLWDIHVVEGLKGGRGALIPRVHHSLADGISGAALLKIMLDPTPEGGPAIRKPRFHPPQRRPAEQSLTDALTNAVHSTLENLLAVEACLVDLAQNLVTDRMQNALQGMTGLLPELAASVERLPFNRPCTGARNFCWTECDFEDVQAIRKLSGATINDVILTVVTRAIARYVELHGQRVEQRFVRLVCPFSLRRDDQRESLGNQISFLPVALPLDIPEPMRMLQAVAKRTEIMKGSRAAELVSLGASWLGSAPPPLQALFWQAIPLIPMPLPLLNMICTNIPGSPTPLYCAGQPMIASYPQVPTGYELGIGCAAHSYNGKIFFGLTSDTHAAPDADRLRDFIQVSFAELCRAAGVKKKKKKKKKTDPRHPARKRPAAA